MQVEEYFKDKTQDAIDGVSNPLDLYIELNNAKKYIEKCMESIKEDTLKEAFRHGNKFDYQGFKIELSDGRKMHKFDHLPNWLEASKQLKEIEETAKAHNESAITYTKPIITIK